MAAKSYGMVRSMICHCFWLLVFAVLLVPGVARAGSVYWADSLNGPIGRGNTDGSAAEIIATAHNFASGIALDEAKRHVYWASHGSETGSIDRANLDGSDKQSIVSNIPSPGPIAINYELNRIFWAAGPLVNQVGIFSANLDGSDIATIASDLGAVSGIAFDNVSGNLYWTDQANRKIVRANFDGSGQTTVLSNLNAPVGLGWDGHGKLYWVSYTDHQVLRANIDGSQMEIIANNQYYPSGIIVDSVNDMVYWSVDRGIRNSSLNGTGLNDVLFGIGQPGALAISLNNIPESATWVQLCLIAGLMYFASPRGLRRVPTRQHFRPLRQ